MTISPRSARGVGHLVKKLPENYRPHIHDVIVGRGRKVHKHNDKNVVFQDLLTAYQDEYIDCTKERKSQIISFLMAEIRHHSKGGFIKKEGKQWWVVDDALARSTVTQALRNQTPENFLSSKQSKKKMRDQKRMVAAPSRHQPTQGRSTPALVSPPQTPSSLVFVPSPGRPTRQENVARPASACEKSSTPSHSQPQVACSVATHRAKSDTDLVLMTLNCSGITMGVPAHPRDMESGGAGSEETSDFDPKLFLMASNNDEYSMGKRSELDWASYDAKKKKSLGGLVGENFDEEDPLQLGFVWNCEEEELREIPAAVPAPFFDELMPMEMPHF